jgi:hypothetical protein
MRRQFYAFHEPMIGVLADASLAEMTPQTLPELRRVAGGFVLWHKERHQQRRVSDSRHGMWLTYGEVKQLPRSEFLRFIFGSEGNPPFQAFLLKECPVFGPDFERKQTELYLGYFRVQMAGLGEPVQQQVKVD